MTDDAIFAYADSIPVNGGWIPVDEDTTWRQIEQDLVDTGYYPGDEILVADADGLAKKFLGRSDFFDLDGFRACAATKGDSAAKAAFIDHYGEWDEEAFNDALLREANSEVEFAQEWFDEIHGSTIQQAEEAGLHIDWEGTARDLFTSDFVFEDGYVFRRI